MDAHNVPPQEEFLYRGCWNPQTDDVFLATLVEEKRACSEHDDGFPVKALMCAQRALKLHLEIHVDWETLCERYLFMKKRYETFKAALRYNKIDWEASTNRMFGNDRVWARIFMKCDFAKAYYTSGEPAFGKLAFLFGEDAIKEEDAPKIVLNVSDLVSPVVNRHAVVDLISDSEEVTSPICNQNPISRRRLFDEESQSCPSASSYFPCPNFYPHKPNFTGPNTQPRKMKKKQYGNVQEFSSEASSSPKSGWNKP